MRIYAFSPLPEGAFMQLMQALSIKEMERPVLSPIWQFPDDFTRRAVEGLVTNIYASARPSEFVLASEDISKQIIAFKTLEESDRAILSSEVLRKSTDWFSYLGIRTPK